MFGKKVQILYRNFLLVAPKQFIFARNIQNDCKVIIIGSGLSGLSAASHLKKFNFKNIKILEASDTYGGRIQSKKFGDTICELGARYLNNPSKQMSKLPLASISNDGSKLFISNKGEIIETQLCAEVSSIFNQILLQTLQSKKVNKKISDNLKIYLEAQTEKLSKNIFNENSKNARNIFNTLTKNLQAIIGCDLSNIHVEHLSKITQNYLINDVKISGLQTVLEPLAKDVSANILYNKPVRQINWSTGIVSCLDETTYEANHIICTLPLGHLKMFSNILFDPPIPKNKLLAIKKLGIGTPENVYIKFSHKIDLWFPSSYLYPVWNFAESSDRQSLQKNISSINRCPQSQFVLQINFSNGEDLRLSDATIIEEVMNFLKSFLRNSNIPYPNEILKSNWGTDAKFLGGIPLLTLEQSKNFVDMLSRPLRSPSVFENIEPVLLFAGDATDWNNFGSMEGAKQSGIREAERIIKFHNTISK